MDIFLTRRSSFVKKEEMEIQHMKDYSVDFKFIQISQCRAKRSGRIRQSRLVGFDRLFILKSRRKKNKIKQGKSMKNYSEIMRDP